MSSLGASCVFSSEWDSAAQKVYTANFGDTPSGDITKIPAAAIPEHDILCAGFPCQAFSISGKQLGFEDPRGTLFFDVARIAEYHKPKALFLENVRNFVSHNNGKTLKTTREILENLGYSFFFDILNAADFGIPQSRKRVYMVAFRSDIDVSEFSFPEKETLKLCVADVLLPENEIPDNLYCHRNDVVLFDKTVNSRSTIPVRVGIVGEGHQGERIYSILGTAITLSASGGGAFSRTGGYLVNGRVRKLHPRECARLMGYPDSYILSENRNVVLKQLGNSVVVDVLQKIGERIGGTIK